MTARATIVVVSWNTRELLRGCLASLAEPAAAGQIEVIVVDNGSKDGSATMVADEYPSVRLCRPSRNLGFGAAVNEGAREMPRREWLVAANADIVVTDGALQGLFDAGTRHPDAGALAPRLELPDGSTQESVFGFPRLSSSALAALGAHKISPRVSNWMFRRSWNPQLEGEVEWAMGAFLAIRREAFDEAGGFDDEQWMYAEDLDICWRLDQLGHATIFVPSATIEHIGGASSEQHFEGRDRTVAEVLFAQQRWMGKRRGTAAATALGAINVASAGVRFAGWKAARALHLSRADDRLARARTWLSLNTEAVRRAR